MRSGPEKPPDRVVLDTNVIASALAFGGLPRTLLELGRTKALEMAVSPFILDELSKVLASRKFAWPASEIEKAVREIRGFMRLVEPSGRVNAIAGKDNDNRILECGLEAGADVIVTGNMRHIRPLRNFQGMEILTPREFVDKYFPSR